MAKIKADCFLIAIKKRNTCSSICLNDNKSFENFVILKNKLGCWAADPFLLDYADKTFLFAEIFNCFSGKGHIEVCCLDDKKIKWQKCKIDDCHLSFPNVQIDELTKKITMVPETNENRKVSEYECLKFPNDWIKSKVLLDNIKAVDSIRYCYNNVEYLFSYVFSKEKNKKLCIFKCNNNEYTLVKEIDDTEKTLRPAGKILKVNGKFILPTQNCLKEYGNGIIFNEINFDDFTIAPIKTIYGNDVIIKDTKKSFCGIHTYNISDNYEVIDLKYRSFSFLRLIGAPFRKIFKTRKK